MKYRLIVMGILLLVSMAVPTSAAAQYPRQSNWKDNTSSCKWGFPWPRQVDYWIEVGSDPYNTFSSAEATRVSYGPATWTEGTFNLYFSRVSSLGLSEGGNTFIAKGVVSSPQRVAEAQTVPNRAYCNVDQGSPMTSAYIIFNQNKSFSLDCAAYQNCGQLQQYDLHDVSAHEAGHWFFLDDIFSGEEPWQSTMYNDMTWGATIRRDLHEHDKDGAWIMYGCRTSDPCH